PTQRHFRLLRAFGERNAEGEARRQGEEGRQDRATRQQWQQQYLASALSPRRRPICGRQQRPSVCDRQLRLRWTDIAASDPRYRRLPHRNLRETCPFATAPNEATPSRLGDRRLSGKKIVDGTSLRRRNRSTGRLMPLLSCFL